ncbi:hypothetical protein RUND412_001504 [Rhizina undulata]
MAQGFSVWSTPTASFQACKVRIKLPFQRNRNFCGREDILDKMRHILGPRNPAKSPMGMLEMGTKGRKSVILYGLGGIGKSQIALEYAHRFDYYYISIFWIDAENVSRTTDSACKIVEQLVVHYLGKSRFSDYQEVAKILGIPGKIDPSSKIRQGARDGGSPKLAYDQRKPWVVATCRQSRQTSSGYV